MKKRLMISLFAGVLMAAMLPGVASADTPETFSDEFTFSDFNPCTGLPQDITIAVDVALHEHRSNFVAIVQRSGTTDDGFVMQGGVERFVENQNGVSAGFMDMWRNPDTGAKFQAAGKFRMRGNAPIVDPFKLRCIGAPTILPS